MVRFMRLSFLISALLLIYPILGIIAWIDWRSYCIPDVGVLAIVGVGLLQKNPPLGQALGIFLLLVTLQKGTRWYFGRMDVLGWGDIKLMSACSLLLPLEELGFFLMATGGLGLLTGLLLCARMVPLGPAIAGGFFMAQKGWLCVQNMIFWGK